MDKLSVEDRLSLSNLEFRSEEGVRELVRIKGKRGYNRFILENSQSIVEYFYSIVNGEFPLISHPPVIYFELLFNDKSDEKIERIKETRLTLEKIAKKEDVSVEEIDEGINFFKELNSKCRDYLSNNH